MRAAKHLKWARDNESLAETFSLIDHFDADWCITVVFYAAVHYVDAYLAARDRTVGDHSEREHAIAHDAILSQIFGQYTELKRMSREARYQMAEYSEPEVKKAKRFLETIKTIILPRITL